MTNLITELAEQYVAEFPNERLDGEWSATAYQNQREYSDYDAFHDALAEAVEREAPETFHLIYDPSSDVPGWYGRRYKGSQPEDHWQFDAEPDAPVKTLLDAAGIADKDASAVRIFRDETSARYEFAYEGDLDDIRTAM